MQRRIPRLRPWAGILLACVGAGCHRDAAPAVAAATTSSADVGLSPTERIAAIAMQTNIYTKPSESSKRIGYLRLGAVVSRSAVPVGNEGCPGGWYAVAPRGFVCNGKSASLEVDAPLVQAASRRPDTTKPLPYPYGFVLAVAPLYLHVPSADEQLASEFHLANHLAWWQRHEAKENVVLLGGTTDHDRPPFWLADGKREVPNVSGFDVPASSVFANRVRRPPGLAFVAGLDGGEPAGDRRFAVTADLRLLPVDKVKPEPGSPFHGLELGDGGPTLPLAFAKPCDRAAKGAPKPCVHTFTADGERFNRTDEVLETRTLLSLTGTSRKWREQRFLQTRAGSWVRAKDVGVAVVPDDWPQAAQRGERWVDVSIEDQTLILWEGKKPVFVTLVSTGQDGMEDFKTSKATPRGTFRIKSKHITATMDSNERSRESGGAAPDKNAGEAATVSESDKGDDPWKSPKGDKHAGQFELRDVPYVQYFQDGYALHAAYWHDHFGLARSHGCVNLSPTDAMRVFGFTEPAVPEGWHGMNVEHGTGTMVVIHK